MFCIYCRTPFDENIDNICTCCGRRLHKEDRSRRGRRQKERGEPEQTEPELPDILELPEDLLHTCRFCGVEFPVLCTNCIAPVSADTIIPPVGWLPCEVCNQSFWVICPHCQRTQQESLPREIQVQPLNPLQEQGQGQPQEQQQHEQQPGQQAQGQGRRSGRVTDMFDQLDDTRPPRPPYQPPSSGGSGGNRPPATGSGLNTARDTWNPRVRGPSDHGRPSRADGRRRPQRKLPRAVVPAVCALCVCVIIIFIWPPGGGNNGGDPTTVNTPPVVINTPDNTATPTPTPEPTSDPASALSPGDRIQLGIFNDDPVYWTVLETQGDKALVISERGLGGGVFQGGTSDPTWERSSARERISHTMEDCDNHAAWHSRSMCDLFTDAEKSRISETTVTTPRRNGRADEITTDHLFLLSEEEYLKYRNLIPIIDGWWLRSPYERDSVPLNESFISIAVVVGDGDVDWGASTYDLFFFRPAMWIILG